MSQPLEILAGTVVELFLLLAALGVLYKLWGGVVGPRRLVVPAFHKGVLVRAGTVKKVVESGSYWVSSKSTLMLCDMRPSPFQITGQEGLTADAVPVRVSVGGEFRISDPSAFVTQSTHSFDSLYLEIRQALRVAIGELTGDSIVAAQTLLPTRLKELLLPRASHLGIEVTHLDVHEAVPVGGTVRE